MPGRTIGLVCLIDKRPAVLIVDLPDQENEHFQLKQVRPVRAEAHVQPGHHLHAISACRPPTCSSRPQGDGLTIAYHGLNLGRVALCANAAGTMRLMMASMIPWAKFRKTYGAAIVEPRAGAAPAGPPGRADRGLRRAGRNGARGLIDEGYRGEMECIIAKIFGSEVAEGSRRSSC